jgi:hypothetical protein
MERVAAGLHRGARLARPADKWRSDARLVSPGARHLTNRAGRPADQNRYAVWPCASPKARTLAGATR